MAEKLSKVIARLEGKRLMRKKWDGARYQTCCIESFIDYIAVDEHAKNWGGLVDLLLRGEILETDDDKFKINF